MRRLTTVLAAAAVAICAGCLMAQAQPKISPDLVQGPFSALADPMTSAWLSKLDAAASQPEKAGELLPAADSAIAQRFGADSRAMAEFMSESLSQAAGLEALLARGKGVVRIEMRLASNAIFWGGYLDGGSTAPSAAAQGTDATARILESFAGALLDHPDAPEADKDKLREAIFETAQALAAGEMARDRARQSRTSALLPDAERIRGQYVFETMKTIKATADLRLLVASGIGRLLTKEQNGAADASERQYAKVIADAVDLLNSRDVDLPDILFPRIVPIGMAQASLRPSDVLVVAVPGEAHYVTLVLTKHGKLKVSLSPSGWPEVAARIASIRANMGVRDGRGATPVEVDSHTDSDTLLADSYFVYQQLLAQAADELTGKSRMLLSVAGPAAHIPFEMLVTEAPVPATDYGQAAWMVRDLPILVLSNLEILADPTIMVPRPLYYAGFGNPDYKAGENSRIRTKMTRLIETLAPLPETETEVRQIAALFGKDRGAAITGRDVNEYQLTALSAAGILKRMGVLHFATHGFIGGDLDYFITPTLAVTPAPEALPPGEVTVDGLLQPVGDGALEFDEILGLGIDPYLVILSSCNSAATGDFGVSGLAGLAGAFFGAGAKNVMGSHWPVVSTAAEELVTGMAIADPPLDNLAAALRSAELDVIAEGGAHSHPRYWAPFSIFGQPVEGISP